MSKQQSNRIGVLFLCLSHTLTQVKSQLLSQYLFQPVGKSIAVYLLIKVEFHGFRRIILSSRELKFFLIIPVLY